ncbi:MAG: MgtC/SapB family protein [Pseudomonadota bacterium]
MPISIESAAFNLVLAMLCGALVGSERQVRQRMAGLRTNALVALGAAGFVVFSALYPDEVSPTRVAAQVVSGIGFLGAGIIFRHGFTVHGLNTAATLWCSAAVGVTAGAGATFFALLLTALIVFVNFGLRPLVKFLKNKTGAGMSMHLDYRVEVRLPRKHHQKVGALIMKRFTVPGVTVTDVENSSEEEGDTVTVTFVVEVEDRDDSLIKSVISPLLIEPRIDSLTWEQVSDL